MEREQIVRGLNLWMDAYIADPATFEAEFQSVMDHLRERESDDEPSYGQRAVTFMEHLLSKAQGDG